MLQHMIFHLSILLLIHIFLVTVLAAPRPNQVVNTESDLILGANIGELAPWSSSHDMGVVTAQLDIVTVPPGTVTVTVTTIETTIIDTVTVVPDVVNGSSAVISEGLTDNQLEMLTIIYAAEPGTNAQASNIGMTHTIADLVTSFQHASSTSQSFRHTNHSTATTFKTITSMTSSSSPTSSLDDDFCDDIFCNTDGNRVCIYWAGFTSWDVSLGPIPGERPTIIGAC
ncbi:hypothetical protein F5X97DRAFT_339863 [Nemania serpens]|nr:hypothetical protein F5X97DRAFT_339863 [Nemania serpens]